MRRLESLARTADVTIFWGFGDNETTANAVADLHEAARRSKRLAIVKVDGNTLTGEVLVSDAYYIKTSFNWLSFRGTSRKYRQKATWFRIVRSSPTASTTGT